MRYLPYLGRLDALLWKGGPPLFVIFFVTNRCAGACPHCFVERSDPSERELGVDDYARIAPSLRGTLVAFLTGGEPFLREDLPDIARVLVRGAGLRQLILPTSGMSPQAVVDAVDRITGEAPETRVDVLLSLDGVGEVHDRIRGVPGLGRRVEETFRELRRLQAGRRNLGVEIQLTYSAFSQGHAEDVYRYSRDVLAADGFFFTVVRGRPRDPAAAALDLDRLETFTRLVDQGMLSRGEGYRGFPFATWMNAKTLLTHRINLQELRTPRYRFPCYAGRLAAVVDPGGRVFPCEGRTTPLGSLPDAGWDLRAVWHSREAALERRAIRRERCHCTHECFRTVGIVYNPRLLPRLLAARLRMVLARAPRP
ncbi:MAG: radical SAM protein [Deltaproteobacteria bacterium]|nr:radical SAM protein [Deltaproteobacteria bacterium]